MKGTPDRAGKKWENARKERSRVLAMLHNFESLTVANDQGGCAPGRTTVLGAKLHNGAEVGTACGREVRREWPWNVEKERARIASCESTVVVAWNPENGGVTDPGAYSPVAYRCGSRLCPVCFAAKAGRQLHRWGPVLDAAIGGGAEVWHVTLTHRCSAEFGSAVLPHETGRWAGVIPTSSELIVPAVAGESAGAAYDRWRKTWHALRTSRWGRGSEDVGFLLGVEFTLRSKRGGRVQLPRWHTHGHLLVIVRPGADWDIRELLAGWARLAGVDETDGVPARWTSGRTKFGTEFIRYGSQYASRVEGRNGLLEVLKYPYKPADMTACGLLDGWTVLRGSRTHVPAGALHGRSRGSRQEPWSEWLAAPSESQPWSVLEQDAPGPEGEKRYWSRVTAMSFANRRGDSLRSAGVPWVRLRVKQPDGSYVEWDEQDLGRWSSVALSHPMFDLTADADDPEPELGLAC